MADPIVGQIVFFTPSGIDPPSIHMGSPLASIVAYVWDDSTVNLMVIDGDGFGWSRTRVGMFVAGDEDNPPTAPPYWNAEFVPPEEIDPMPAKPELTQLDPASVTVGGPDVKLYCLGTGFTSNSVINFAGHDEPTTFENGYLSTGLTTSLFVNPDTVDVFVKDGDQVSETLQFTFLPAPEEEAPPPETEEEARTKGERDPLKAAPHPRVLVDPDDVEEELDQTVDDGDATKTGKKKKK